MLVTFARAASFALALIATRGCIGPDGLQLGGDDGSDGAPWTECDEELMAEGRNGDYCTFDEGSGCGTQDYLAEGRPWVASTCVDGRLIRSQSTVVAEDLPEDRCREVNVEDWHRISYDVRAGTFGCLDVARCDHPDHGALQSLCQDPQADAVREGATDVTPWTDCAAALQEGTDRDPCVGEFLCAAERELSPGSSTGTLAAWCDQGVLRLYSMMLLHGY